MRHASLTFGLVASTLFFHAAARASEPETDSIGTRPAAETAPVTVAAEARTFHGSDAPVAVDPPPDWAFLHAGFRPKLGRFGGLATLALAHARTERFYGGVSF
jgi:hypothetical protein